MTEFVYNQSPLVELDRVGSRPVLITPQGGKVVVDEKLASLWLNANGRTLNDILKDEVFTKQPHQHLKAALACLVEAGFLDRTGYQFHSASSSDDGKVKKLLGRDSPLTIDHSPVIAHYGVDVETSQFDTTIEHPNPIHSPLSVVIVAYNSRQWLEKCIQSLNAQTFQPSEIIVVDNDSDDDGVSIIQSSFPFVKIVSLRDRVSLSAAINRGAHEARGDYFLLLNPDVELEYDAIAQMISVAQSAKDIAAVAPKLRLLWSPSFLNGIGNRVGAFSWGIDNALGHLDLGQFDDWVEIPAACFAAVLIPRQALQEVGMLDEEYPLYYEDSDWCYRARLLGWRILAAPKAVVYHAFGSHTPDSHKARMTPDKYSQVTYGRYRFVRKIIGERRYRFFGGYLIEDSLSLFFFLIRGDFSYLLAYGRAVRQLIADYKTISQLRRQIQATRKVNDHNLFAPQRNMPMPFIWRGMPELTWDIIQRTYLPLMLSGKTKPIPEFTYNHHPSLLIVSHDVVDEKMAGPGMRYWEIAQAIKHYMPVTLAVPKPTSLQDAEINIVTYQETSPAILQSLVEENEIALISGYMAEKFPFLKTTSTRLIVDLYTPMVLENIHYYFSETMDVQMAANLHGVKVMNELIKIGDFFICGNERQRDFWLGVLTAQGRVNPLNYAADSRLYKLIDIVGMGFPSRPPHHDKAILRGVHPNVPNDAKIVLWGGGLWNWLDPLTLVYAWQQVIAQHPSARLVFLGTRHPNESVPPHEMALKTIQLAEQIGEKDKTILFLEWLSYKDREALLVEADLGVTLHPIHAETRFSLRTRVLDYIWAELPTVITDGDVTSEWVREYGIGRVVAESDVDGVAEAINHVLQRSKESYRASFEPLKRKYTWANVVQPIVTYCLNGDIAPDRRQRNAEISPSNANPAPLTKAHFATLMRIWREQGAKGVLHRLWRYVQWKLSQL